MIPHAVPAHRLHIRALGCHENHHLWNNNGTWWLNFTLLAADGRSCGVRRSLKTRDIAMARRRRDRVLQALAVTAVFPDLKPSATNP